MKLTSLTYRRPGGNDTQKVALQTGLQFMYCRDAYTAGSLAKTLERLLNAPAETDGDALVVESEMTGYGKIKATLSAETADGACSVSAAPALMRLSVEDFAEKNEPDHVAYVSMARELACLTDTGTFDGNLLSVLARLDAFAVQAGRDHAPEGPLTQAQVRLDMLKDEHKQACKAYAEADSMAVELGRCRDHVLALREQYRHCEKLRCAVVLQRVQQLQMRLEEVDRDIRATEALPAIGADQAASIQRAENLVQTSRLQLERVREELEETIGEIQEGAGSIGEQDGPGPELPEQLQRDIRVCLGRITELNGRIDEVNSQITALDMQISATQEQLADLPDFSRIAANPVDWLNQLASSFKTALAVRDEECGLRDHLRDETGELRIEIAGDAAIFDNSQQFTQELIEHEKKKKVWESKSAQLNEQLQQCVAQRDEMKEMMPGLFVLAIGCAFFLMLLLGVYVGVPRSPILIPAVLFLLSIFYFITRIVLTRQMILRLTRDIAGIHEDMAGMEEEQKNTVSQIERLMARAGCATARELEARYDRYRELRGKLESLTAQYRQQEENAIESGERIPKLFERIRSTLEQVEETPRDERDVEGAAGRAVAKYQVYRETKRHLADLRNQHQGLIGRRRFLDKELATVRERLLDAEQQLRTRMRAHGFSEEAEHKDINVALAAYYRSLDTVAEITNRHELLEHRRQALEKRKADDEALFLQHKHTLHTLLGEAGLASVEAARDAAANAGIQRDRIQERRAINQQIETLLEGRDLDSWRALAVDADQERIEAVADDLDNLTRELAEHEEQLNQALGAYYQMHRKRKRCLDAWRPLAEYEEDRANVEAHLESLQYSISAAARAMALMEETVMNWRPRCAKAIGERAEEFLRIIGSEASVSVCLEPGDEPSIQIEPRDAAPVTTAALIVRLAAIDILAGAGEDATPLVVDAAVRGIALPAAPEGLLAVIAECAQARQVLLVSEDERLHAAACEKGLPVLMF